MKLKGKIFLIIGIVLVLLFVIGAFFYYSIAGKDYTSRYERDVADGTLVNPVDRLSTEEAVANFDESFIYYLLYEIKAYNLHNPPLSSDEPKLFLYVGEQVYSASIRKGDIIVSKSAISGYDAIIRMSALEGVLMLQDKSYISKSFQEGKSSIELVADKTTLFGKGYLNLYTELTGKGITGNVLRIYAG